MITETILQDLENRFKGKEVRVKSTANHPHSGEVGEIEAVEIVAGKPAILVKGEYNSFYVFNPKELQLLK